MRRLTVLVFLVAITISPRLSHAEDKGRVILERSRVSGDSAQAGDTHDVYAISRKTFDALSALDLRIDAMPLSSERAVKISFQHLKGFYAKEKRTIKDGFVVWRVELKHVPGTKHDIYQGKFYYFVELHLFSQSGTPFFSRRAVLLDGTVVSPVREYDRMAKSQPDAAADADKPRR